MKKLLILFLVLFLGTPAIAADWTDNLEMGGDVRFRWYKLNNIWDFDDTNNFDNWETFRLRTRIFAKAKVSDDISGFVRLANQTYGNGVSDAGDNASNKVFVDNAYITVDNFFGSNFKFQAGRMNLMYGSGFVLFDGNSQFASTSLYFDGVKLAIPLGDKMVLDALYFIDEENKRANNPDNDITLGGAYLTAHCPVMGSDKGQQEIYALNRRDEFLSKEIWMFGLRLSDKFENGLDYSGEVAYQVGDWNDRENIDQEALGYKLDAGFTLKDAPMSPRIFCGYMSLDGDDPDTEENERWDVFYGGWPQFGDLLAWKYVNLPGTANAITDYDPNWAEGSTNIGEAVYSNISMGSVGIGAKLTSNLSAKFTYGLLTVDEPDYIDPDTGLKVKNDDDFGDYYQLQAKYGYSKNLSFAMYIASIDPGDAFKTDDDAFEFFVETNLKF
ncbi:MAG: alginate export family protein [Desulfobacteraceae bacterium]|nr:alginate export family protein [Desulfobacteraceae bacterium]MBC2754209.1 alginate export family protein [Desulfobacteraceae bacterium]